MLMLPKCGSVCISGPGTQGCGVKFQRLIT
jgi:hypothetical protein